jgi:transcriptional regulator with XRE-family HTH domain
MHGRARLEEADPPWSQALKILRVIRRWNQQELAAAVGMTASAISRFEGGSRGKGQEELMRRLTAAMGFPAHLLQRTLAFVRLAEAAREIHGAAGGAPPAAAAELSGRLGLWMEDLARQAFHQALTAAGAPYPALPPEGATGGPPDAEDGRGSAAQEETRPLGEALIILRGLAGWGQRQLAAAVGLSVPTISNYEQANTTPDLETWHRMLDRMGFPAAMLERTLSFVESARQAREYAAAVGEAALRAQAESMAAQVALSVEVQVRATLDQLMEGARLLESRQQAPAFWQRLAGCSQRERLTLLRGQSEFHTVGFCERLCDESLRAAADSAARAVELAELAVEVAGRVAGPAWLRSRVKGYARMHLANAVRVAGRPRRAQAIFERGAALWRAGAAADPGLLNEARVLSLEASLRRALRQLPEALALLDRALALDRWGERTSLLIGKARALEETGEFALAIPLLREAASAIDPDREPRKLFNARQNLLLNVCRLGRHGEASLGLPEVRAMARRLGRLDLARVDWLEGKVAAGLGWQEQAVAALERARSEFRRQGIAYDTALVTLELAEVHAALGRTAEVKALALASAPVFREQGVHREARRALEVFRRAAEQERAPVELVRRVIAFLDRARHDPGLRFGEAAA